MPNSQISVLDATGATQAVAKVPDTGQSVMTTSLPVTIASDQSAVPVSATALPLPSGAATATGVAAIVTALGTPAQAGATQAISAAGLPLPTGAATSALQTAINTILTGGTQMTAITGTSAQAALGLIAKPSPFGTLQVQGSSTVLMSDTFDAALDTVNNWTLSGTTLPTASSGQVTLSLGTGTSLSSVMVSQQLFSPKLAPFSLPFQMNIGAAQTNPNCHRFFGPGVVTSYAAATPVTDGFGFEVDVTGALNAVVWVGGTRYVVNSTNVALITASGGWATGMFMSTLGQTMTYPANGTAIVNIQYFNGYAYFYLSQSATGLDIPIGLASWIPNVVSLPVRIAAITAASGTILATTFTGQSFLLGVGGGTNWTQSDPTFPWRQQTIDASGRAAVNTPVLTSTGTITTQNLVPAGVATAGSAVSLTTGGFPTLMIQTTGVYTGALSLQMTVDNVNWVTVAGVPLLNVNTGGNLATITSALASIFQADVAGATAVRVTGLAAMTGTATVTLNVIAGAAAMVALDAPIPAGANIIGALTANQSVNLGQLAAATTSAVISGGAATKSLGVALGAPSTLLDYSAQAWAATSGNGATIVSDFGPVCSFLVNVTAWTAGSSTGLDVFLQWSPDNGTNWFDLWQCEAMTGIASVFIPAIFIPGRRRMRWVNRTGAATTATVNVTAMQHNVEAAVVRQWFDRTATLLSGTAAATSAAYDVVGCRNITCTVVLGAVTTLAGTYQIQLSNDGTNWAGIGTATIGVANTATAFTVSTYAARFARVICTVAANGQTGTYVALSGN